MSITHVHLYEQNRPALASKETTYRFAIAVRRRHAHLHVRRVEVKCVEIRVRKLIT